MQSSLRECLLGSQSSPNRRVENEKVWLLELNPFEELVAALDGIRLRHEGAEARIEIKLLGNPCKWKYEKDPAIVCGQDAPTKRQRSLMGTAQSRPCGALSRPRYARHERSAGKSGTGYN